MKGQTPAITAVLITSVIVGSVATAYVWGTPLLEKRQGEADLDRTETDVENLYDKIVQVSESGEGTTDRVSLGGDNSDIEIDVNPETDSIDIKTSAQRSPYPVGSWTLIEGKSLQNISFGTGSYGVEGSDLPGVLGVRPAGGAGEAVLNYRIEFRNILADTPTGQRLERIDITSAGRTRSTGDSTLLISNDGTELDSGSDRIALPSGEKVERRRTVVEIDIR